MIPKVFRLLKTLLYFHRNCIRCSSVVITKCLVNVRKPSTFQYVVFYLGNEKVTRKWSQVNTTMNVRPLIYFWNCSYIKNRMRGNMVVMQKQWLLLPRDFEFLQSTFFALVFSKINQFNSPFNHFLPFLMGTLVVFNGNSVHFPKTFEPRSRTSTTTQKNLKSQLIYLESLRRFFDFIMKSNTTWLFGNIFRKKFAVLYVYEFVCMRDNDFQCRLKNWKLSLCIFSLRMIRFTITLIVYLLEFQSGLFFIFEQVSCVLIVGNSVRLLRI